MILEKLFPENKPLRIAPENQDGEFIDRYIHVKVSLPDRIRLLFSGRAYIRHVVKVDKKVEFTDDSSFTVNPPSWMLGFIEP